jgi:hypothetical protein
MVDRVQGKVIDFYGACGTDGPQKPVKPVWPMFNVFCWSKMALINHLLAGQWIIWYAHIMRQLPLK